MSTISYRCPLCTSSFYVMQFSDMLIKTRHTWIHFLPTHKKTDLVQQERMEADGPVLQYLPCIWIRTRGLPSICFIFERLSDVFFSSLHHWCYDWICDTLNSGSEHTVVLNCFAFSHEPEERMTIFLMTHLQRGLSFKLLPDDVISCHFNVWLD